MELYCDLLAFYGEYDIKDRSQLEGFVLAVWRKEVQLFKFDEADAILEFVVDASNRFNIIVYNECSGTWNGLLYRMAQQMIFHRNQYPQISVTSHHGGPSKLWSEGFYRTVWLTNDIKYNLLAHCLTEAEDYAYILEYDHPSGQDDEYDLPLPEA